MERLLEYLTLWGEGMKKAVSVFLCDNITRKDVLALIDWMSNEHITKYLNEDNNIVDQLKYLLWYSDDAMLPFQFKRFGKFYFVRLENNKPIGFISLKEKKKDNYEVVYVIGQEELWGHGLGTEALRQALYTIFLLFRAKSLVAMVHKDNIRSIRSVNKCNFQIVDESSVYIKFKIEDLDYLQYIKKKKNCD